MESFGELLKKCIEKNVVSVSDFSREIGINRGWLYFVFDGNRKLPEDKFQLILEKLRLPAPLESRLRVLYYENVYGIKPLERIIYTYDTLKSLSLPEKAAGVSRTFTPEKETVSIAGMENIAACVSYIMKAERANDLPRVYTNYPYTCKLIDDEVYAVLSSRGKKIDLSHLISFDISGDDTTNLGNIFCSLRYARLRSSPLYIYTDVSKLRQPDLIYPYFFATESCVLFFNPVSGMAIFTADSSIANSVQMYLRQALPQYLRLVYFPKNEMELKQVILNENKQQIAFSISTVLGLGDTFDYDILNELVRDDLPVRDTIIQIAAEHWGQYEKNEVLRMDTAKAYERFAKTGIITEVSSNFAKKASLGARKKILKKICESLDSAEPERVLIDSKKLPLPQGISFEIGNQSFTVCGLISKDDKAYSGEFVINLQDKTLISDFFNFREYIIRNGFVMSCDFFKHFLEDLILRCEDGVPD